MNSLPAVAERFLRYVTIDTQSSPTCETYPSTTKQLNLSRMLVAELNDLGVTDAALDEHGYVMATIESNVDVEVPTIGFISHVDTSPELSGANVKPKLHLDYLGGDLALNDEYTLSPKQSPDLLHHLGHTIITTDGTTLLGADDKAGIAEIMTFVETLMRHPEIPHGTIRIAFTCDEEIGRGTKLFDVKRFGARYAYTVDGDALGRIENETFCADSAQITFKGINVHPGYAKDKLVNALRVAAHFLEMLPKGLSPERTEGREGYVHPIHVEGSVEQATVQLILRDFEEKNLVAQRQLIDATAKLAEAAFPGAKVTTRFDESYRNMRYQLEDHAHVVEYAMEATRRIGLNPVLGFIRGGTDGALLSYQGLPTPNLFTGGHLYHSRFEWVAIEGMQLVVKMLVELVQVWVEKSRA